MAPWQHAAQAVVVMVGIVPLIARDFREGAA